MTIAVELILMGMLVGFTVGFLLGRWINSGNKTGKKSPSIPIVLQKPTPLPADVEQRVQALIDDGHKMGALKELRDSTDLEFKKAKNIVDSMVTSTPANTNTDKIGTVRDLIRSGHKIEALKLYRESSGMSLEEAEEAIDKMEKEFG